MATDTRPAAGSPRTIRAVMPALSALLLCACSINPKVEISELSPNVEPVRLTSVPFYAQTQYQCGPAALAGVLGASGVGISPEALVPQVYLPEREGSLQIELMAASRRSGRVPYQLDPEPAALLGELEAGRPVLVMQNLRTRHFPQWHYAVLTGMDSEANRVVLNTGTSEGVQEGARTFFRTWTWAGEWAIVVLRPGELPASPDPSRYMQSVANFESVAGAGAALPAWQAAMERWPQDHRPYLALGNARFASGEYQQAASLFGRGLELKPGDVVLENNLASALGEAGCPRSAERRLQRVFEQLGDDSTWREAVRTTLEELRSSPGPDRGPCRDILVAGPLR